MVTESSTSNSITSKLGRVVGDSKAAWVLLVGVVLFFLPEPLTSILGVIVILFGAALWLFESML